MSGGAQGETQGRSETGAKGERVAKVIARAGICSRRDAERLVAAGRVALNGRVLDTPAVTVGPEDRIEVDGKLLETRERTRLWLFHKPKGLVTTNRDPEGRPTVFSALPRELPRVLTVGRLDINTEGLLLLTNDGGLARLLELPSTGWLRRYRVRAHGRIDQAALDALRQGVTIDGMIYGAIEAEVERVQGSNLWLLVGLREGKNREIRRVMEHLGLSVNRLIRVSYGPFQLGDLDDGEVREVRGRVLRDQLGDRLATAAGADFDAPIRQPEPEEAAPGAKKQRSTRPVGPGSRATDERDGAKARAAERPGARKAAAERAGARKASGEPSAAPARRSDGPAKNRRPPDPKPHRPDRGGGGKARGTRNADRRRPP